MTDAGTPSPEPTPPAQVSTFWKRHRRWLFPAVLLAALALWFVSGPSDREILEATREFVVSRGRTVTSLSIVEHGSSWWPGECHVKVRIVGGRRRFGLFTQDPLYDTFDDTVSLTFKRDPYGKLEVTYSGNWGM